MSASRPPAPVMPPDDMAHAVAHALGGDRFLTDDLGSEPVHGRVDDPDVVRRHFSFDRLSEIVTTSWLRPPRIRMYAGDAIEPGRYMTLRQSRTELEYVAPDPAKIRRRLDEGATLVVSSLEAIVPAIADTSRALQWWLGCTVATTAYGVRGETEGFAPHVDDHDVLVVQAQGTKCWQIWAPTRTHPLARDVVRPGRPTGEGRTVTMEPGDVLYLPRGWWHTARSTDADADSVHLTRSLHRRTGIDWVRWLADRVLDDDEFRSDLPEFDVDAGTHHDVLVARLCEVARRNSWRDHLHHDRVTCPAATLPALAPVGAADATRGRLVSPFPPEITDADRGVVVRAGGKQLRFDPRCRPMVEMLATGGWCDVADLPADGLPPRAVVDTLAALDEAGLVELART